MKMVYSFITLCLLFCSCDKELIPPYLGFEEEGFEMPFDLNNPDTILKLPKQLKEISGLTWGEENSVFAINDEKGNVYRVSLSDGSILDNFDFGKDDDYEGIARNGNIIYVVESNGNIKVVNLGARDQVNDFDTYLSKRNDVEGLCFSEKDQSLLLACKGDMEEKDGKYKKAIYKFRLATGQLDKKPYSVLRLKELDDKLNRKNLTDNTIIDLSLEKRLSLYGPSAIDIDPLTGNIYTLSNRGKLLVVSTPQSQVLGIYFLGNRTYGQPEGLCFDPQGNLYISNEARSRQANIHIISRGSSKRKTKDKLKLKDLVPDKKDTKEK